jgi:hypothetical protein
MTKMSSSIFGLLLSFSIPAYAEESQPLQPPAQKVQTKAACRSKCETQYPDCASGAAPMHGVCELFDQCLRDCD